MTLKEISAQYEAAAEPLRVRLRELRTMLAQTDDPEEIWHIKRRIAELTPMLTQLNDLAWMLDHYYERSGADRDTRYGFNGIRPPKENQRKADENLASDLKRRVNRFAAGNFLGLSLPEENNPADSCGAGGTQKHRQQNIEACGAESEALHEVLQGVSDSFPRYPKK